MDTVKESGSSFAGFLGICLVEHGRGFVIGLQAVPESIGDTGAPISFDQSSSHQVKSELVP